MVETEAWPNQCFTASVNLILEAMKLLPETLLTKKNEVARTDMRERNHACAHSDCVSKHTKVT